MEAVNEQVIDESGFGKTTSDDVFWYQPENITRNVYPIYDNEINEVIGFQYHAGGYSEIYDIDGGMIEISELPLEAPPIDPLDPLLFIGLGTSLLRKTVGFFSNHPARYVPTMGIVARGGLYLAKKTLATLRSTFRAVKFRGTLKFTETAGKHMLEQGRYVPLHLLKTAVKYGKRTPDPQGKKGIFKYVMTIYREKPSRLKIIDDSYKGAIFNKYELEVVIKESENLIVHFLYK
jgi:hypothetical protein